MAASDPNSRADSSTFQSSSYFTNHTPTEGNPFAFASNNQQLSSDVPGADFVPNAELPYGKLTGRFEGAAGASNFFDTLPQSQGPPSESQWPRGPPPQGVPLHGAPVSQLTPTSEGPPLPQGSLLPQGNIHPHPVPVQGMYGQPPSMGGFNIHSHVPVGDKGPPPSQDQFPPPSQGQLLTQGQFPPPSQGPPLSQGQPLSQGPPPSQGQLPTQGPPLSQGPPSSQGQLPTQGPPPLQGPLLSQGQLPSQGQFPPPSQGPPLSQGQLPTQGPTLSQGQLPSQGNPPTHFLPPSQGLLSSQVGVTTGEVPWGQSGPHTMSPQKTNPSAPQFDRQNSVPSLPPPTASLFGSSDHKEDFFSIAQPQSMAGHTSQPQSMSGHTSQPQSMPVSMSSGQPQPHATTPQHERMPSGTIQLKQQVLNAPVTDVQSILQPEQPLGLPQSTGPTSLPIYEHTHSSDSFPLDRPPSNADTVHPTGGQLLEKRASYPLTNADMPPIVKPPLTNAPYPMTNKGQGLTDELTMPLTDGAVSTHPMSNPLHSVSQQPVGGVSHDLNYHPSLSSPLNQSTCSLLDSSQEDFTSASPVRLLPPAPQAPPTPTEPTPPTTYSRISLSPDNIPSQSTPLQQPALPGQQPFQNSANDQGNGSMKDWEIIEDASQIPDSETVLPHVSTYSVSSVSTASSSSDPVMMTETGSVDQALLLSHAAQTEIESANMHTSNPVPVVSQSVPEASHQPNTQSQFLRQEPQAPPPIQGFPPPQGQGLSPQAPVQSSQDVQGLTPQALPVQGVPPHISHQGQPPYFLPGVPTVAPPTNQENPLVQSQPPTNQITAAANISLPASNNSSVPISNEPPSQTAASQHPQTIVATSTLPSSAPHVVLPPAGVQTRTESTSSRSVPEAAASEPTPAPVPQLYNPGPPPISSAESVDGGIRSTTSSQPPSTSASVEATHPHTSHREGSGPPLNPHPHTSHREGSGPPLNPHLHTSPREGSGPPLDPHPHTSPREGSGPPLDPHQTHPQPYLDRYGYPEEDYHHHHRDDYEHYHRDGWSGRGGHYPEDRRRHPSDYHNPQPHDEGYPYRSHPPNRPHYGHAPYPDHHGDPYYHRGYGQEPYNRDDRYYRPHPPYHDSHHEYHGNHYDPHYDPRVGYDNRYYGAYDSQSDPRYDYRYDDQSGLFKDEGVYGSDGYPQHYETQDVSRQEEFNPAETSAIPGQLDNFEAGQTFVDSPQARPPHWSQHQPQNATSTYFDQAPISYGDQTQAVPYAQGVNEHYPSYQQTEEHAYGTHTDYNEGYNQVDGSYIQPQDLAYGEQQYEYNNQGYDANQLLEPIQATPPPTPRQTPELFAHPHVRASFGFGGQLVTVLPHSLLKKQTLSVEISLIKDLVKDTDSCSLEESVNSFPGPFLPGSTPKNQVIQYANREAKRVREKVSILSQSSGDCLEVKQLEDEVLMWEFLVLLCQQNGVVLPTDVSDLLLKDRSLSINSSLHLGTSDKEEALGTLRDLILAGQRKDALDLACSKSLWGHALMLSSVMDEQSRNYVVNRFTASLMSTDPLGTFYTLLLGRIPSAVKADGLQRAGDWRPHLAMILANRVSKLDTASIVSLGDSLMSQKRLHAAHLCFFLGGVHFEGYGSQDSRFSLLGSDCSNFPRGSYPHPDSLRKMEVFEFAMSLSKQEFSLPGFQMFKFLYILKLSEVGYVEKALKYCEQISHSVMKGPRHYTPILLNSLVDISVKLHHLTTPFGIVENELPSWLSHLEKCVEDVLLTNYTPNPFSPSPAFSSVSQTFPSNQQGTQPIIGLQGGQFLAVPSQGGSMKGGSELSSKEGSLVNMQLGPSSNQVITGHQLEMFATPQIVAEQHQQEAPVQLLQGQPSSSTLMGEPDGQDVMQYPYQQQNNPSYPPQQTETLTTGSEEVATYQQQEYYGYQPQEGVGVVSGSIEHVQSGMEQMNMGTSEASGIPQDGLITNYVQSEGSQVQLQQTSQEQLNQQYTNDYSTLSYSTSQPHPQMTFDPSGGVQNVNQSYWPQGVHESASGVGDLNQNKQEIEKKEVEPVGSHDSHMTKKEKEEPQESEGKEEKKSAKDVKKASSSGWGFNILKYIIPNRKNQAHLPPDTDKSIYWDEKQKKWVDTTGNAKDEAPPPPPPSDSELKQSQPSTTLPPSHKGTESTDGSGGVPSEGGPPNQYSRQGSKRGHLGTRSKYVDVLNPGGGSTHSSTGDAQPPPPPASLGAPLMPGGVGQPFSGSFFVPQQPAGEATTESVDPSSASPLSQQSPSSSNEHTASENQVLTQEAQSGEQRHPSQNVNHEQTGTLGQLPPVSQFAQQSGIGQPLLQPDMGGQQLVQQQQQPGQQEPSTMNPPMQQQSQERVPHQQHYQHDFLGHQSTTEQLPQQYQQDITQSQTSGVPSGDLVPSSGSNTIEQPSQHTQFFNPSAFAPVSGFPPGAVGVGSKFDSQDDAMSTVSLMSETSQEVSSYMGKQRTSTSAGYNRLRQGIRGTRGYPTANQQTRPRPAGHAPLPSGQAPPPMGMQTQMQQWQ